MKLNFDFKIHFHDPVIFYTYEKNEVWVQNLHEPKVINRYIFINSISANSIEDEVYDRRLHAINVQKATIELLLTYEKCHRISTLFIQQRFGSGVRLSRMKKSIYFSNLPDSTILSFQKLNVVHTNQNGDLCILFHYANQLKFFLPAINQDKKTVHLSFEPKNIIRFVSTVFFADPEGREIYCMNTFIDKNDKDYVNRVYESKNKIMLFKKIWTNDYIASMMI